MQRRSSPRRVLALGAILAALLAAPSIARADCGDQIVDEVFNTGSIEGAYALRCYDLAITKLEGDADEYSEARGIISSAKVVRRNQLANQQEQEQQPEQPQGGQDEPGRSDSAEAPSGGGDGGGAGRSEGGGAEELEPTGDAATADAEGAFTEDELAEAESLSEEDVTTEAAPASFDDGDDGTPLPVLLLGGAAIALIAVGAGGLVWRRVNGA